MQNTPAFIELRKRLCQRQMDVEAFFRDQWRSTHPVFYGSVDLRNAGFKIAPVDTNLFPAGFNNLNPNDMPLFVQAAQATFAEVSPDTRKILIIPENHTRNMFYFESLAMLKAIFTNAGFEVRLGSMAEEITEPTTITLPSKKEIIVEALVRKDDKVGVADFFPCRIVLNNDLSSGVPKILENLGQKVMPNIELGWSNRLKSEHFDFYQRVCEEFAAHLEIDPWLIMPFHDRCPEVDFQKNEGAQCLVDRTKILFDKIQKKYTEYKIDQKPFVVVKADNGTYGMAVMMIRDPHDLAHLNRKQRTSMSTVKGGIAVTKAIIQEGVYSFETAGPDKSIAEPVVYSFGRHVIGGFYRVHKNKGPDENLNSPGMDFLPMPFKKSCHLPAQNHRDSSPFYIYGIIARLAMVAAARELASFEKKEIL
jgi:glutamate--cysteine ligase